MTRVAARPIARLAHWTGHDDDVRHPRPAPKAEGAIPATVRFDPGESRKIDHWILDLREQTGTR